jgi:hypothetical protein
VLPGDNSRHGRSLSAAVRDQRGERGARDEHGHSHGERQAANSRESICRLGRGASAVCCSARCSWRSCATALRSSGLTTLDVRLDHTLLAPEPTLRRSRSRRLIAAYGGYI